MQALNTSQGKANSSPCSSSSGYIKHDKRLRAEGLAQQRDQGWLQEPQGPGIGAVLDAAGGQRGPVRKVGTN